MSESPESKKTRSGRAAARRAAEALVGRLIEASGWTAIAVLTAIAVFLAVNAYQALVSPQAGLVHMLTGTAWYPTSAKPLFGFLPARNAARLDPIEALARE